MVLHRPVELAPFLGTYLAQVEIRGRFRVRRDSGAIAEVSGTTLQLWTFRLLARGPNARSDVLVDPTEAAEKLLRGSK